MTDNSKIIETAEQLDEAITFPPEAYISKDYARAEQDKLWRKVWQQAGRLEDIPKVGNFITYEIMDDSVIIIRTAEDTIKAFHNVCSHRGRRLIDTPEGARNASGFRAQFVCPFHGWRFNTDGKNADIQYEEDWQGALTEDLKGLSEVKTVGTWGGWIWVNLDPDCEPLAEFLGVLPHMLDPFELQNMRPRWRKWGIFDCNWKVAMEAFNETYHVQTTHPEFTQYGTFRGWARVQGRHSHIGYDTPKGMDENQSAKLRVGTTADPRKSTADLQNYTWTKANTNTTQTLVDAANRLVDELPEGTPAGEVLVHWLTQARKDDEARGVFWPKVDPAHVGKSGTAWQIFPNFQIGHAVNNALCYSARPYGDDPDKCIFEAVVYELFPEGEEPKAEWEFSPATEEDWCYVLSQDFSNMAAMQKGMKSMGFSGPKPNPYMERSTANLHFNLSQYMNAGMVKKL